MSWLSSLTGNDAARAARQAALDTYNKQLAATEDYRAYGDTLPAAYNNIAQGVTQAYAPYTQAGTDALSRLMAGLGLGGDTAGFTNAYRSLPGYQSALETGTRAANSALNAGHIGQSGRALKALTRYGQDYEDQKSGDYLTRLQGLTGMGLSATGSSAGLGAGLQAQGLGAQTGVRQGVYQGMYGGADTIGKGITAGAQAQQQGITNLMNIAAYLGGRAIGGGVGGGGGAGSFFSPSGYGGGFPVFGA